MQHTELDHLVVAVPDLASGADWCRRTLGVDPAPGGRHALMGTHNRLVVLAAPDAATAPPPYLELLAIDPTAPAPGRARWFGLDAPALQSRLQADGPQLVGWVARSGMLDMHRWGLLNCRLQPGNVLKAERETPQGLLRWQIVVRDDGEPVAAGAVPTLIQWQGPHPSQTLPASPLVLRSLTVRGLPDQAAQVLRVRGARRAADPGPVLEADVDTPLGPRKLASAATWPLPA